MSRKPWDFENPLCAEIGTELFFLEDRDRDEKTMPVSQEQYKQAQKTCYSCVHRIECAEWAIYNEAFGVWGGLTAKDRKQIRIARRINFSLSSTLSTM